MACQYQEDGLQQKRVAQCTLLVHEHTQAFDGGHIRRRLHIISISIVITGQGFEFPLFEFGYGDSDATLPIIPIPISLHMGVTA